MRKRCRSRWASLGCWLALAAVAAGLAGCGAPDESAALGNHRAGLVLGTVRWQQPLATLPPSRMGHALIYDSARGVTLAVGGRPVDDTGNSAADTWAWDGSAWTELPASFPPRGYIQGVFDSTRQVSVIYGGIDAAPTSAYFAETLERAGGTWSNRAGTPGARSSSGLAFDSVRGVTVLFGGFDGGWRNDIWEWDGTLWTQRCTTAPCNTSVPSLRAGMVLSYDAARQQTVLFGGFESTGSDVYFGDTWTWDGNAWTQRTPQAAPSARVSAAAAYDPVTQLVYLFGGADAGGEFGDLWAWDGSTWQQVDAGSSGARRDAKLAWDVARRRGVLYGGRSGSSSVDFQELSLVGNECTTSDTCHTGVCNGAVCVEPDADAGSIDDAGDTSSGGAAGAGGAAGSGAAGTSAAAGTGGAAGGAGSTSMEPDAGSSGAAGVTPPARPHAREAKSFYACAVSPGEHAARGGTPGLALLAAGAWLGRRRARR